MKLIDDGVKRPRTRTASPSRRLACRTIWLLHLARTPRHVRPLRHSRRAAGASTSNGSPKPSASKRGKSAWSRRSNGWRRESGATASTKTTEQPIAMHMLARCGGRLGLQPVWRGLVRSAPRQVPKRSSSTRLISASIGPLNADIRKPRLAVTRRLWGARSILPSTPLRVKLRVSPCQS
jgi:hypothetical protein